ncbi:ABC transporter permease subunit [Endozoicomonas sp. SM1973]|uniref:ABC transporter permease subunit n=1 Tax=Spartinivicinus marinus TaxID=2994442 RepID=A0A853HYH8_9GAMM|nr:ABC transporter permease subunit [Spartinivicinus marinus]MCX4024718.1 ABC transporter permease subunit [Spartinivicinus marinus]NYZ66253.1 ABC transporter permease subunit [Spartinivicinus marinus]
MLFTTAAWFGFIIVSLIFCFTTAALVALASEGWGAFNWQTLLDPYLLHITGFSLKQALLSTVISLLCAIPVAKLIGCRQFKGKQGLLTTFNLCFVLPTIVVVLGVVSVYGRSGWLNQWLNSEHSIYGLPGILLCHVFINFPFATRVLVNAIEQIPVNQWRVAEQLGFNRFYRFYWLEWHAIKSQLFPLLGLIFLLCFNSFTIVLAMGGGPQSTTLEVAIYQALRYDYEPGFAVLLATLQLVITAPIALMLFYYQPALKQTKKSSYQKPTSLLDKWLLIPVLIAVTVWVLLPFMALIKEIINWQAVIKVFSLSLINAGIKSLIIAVSTSFLTICMALVINALLFNLSSHYKANSLLRPIRRQFGAAIAEGVSANILYFPAIVLATGWFILLWQLSDVFQYTLWLVIIINVLMAMPFAIRIIKVPFFQIASHYQQLSMHLGVTGWHWWWVVAWPALSTAIGQAAALAFVLSLGDMGIVALIGDPDFITLPLLVYQYLANYQYPQAAVLSVVLLISCFICFYLIEKLFRRQNA